MEKKKTSKKTTTKPIKKEDKKTTKKVVERTKKNKKIKGFTLVELLAVIVILAVVMLVAVTSVGPMMAKSRKSSLGTEGIAMINASKELYNQEQTKGTSARYTTTSSVCYDLKYLCKQGVFEKGCGDDDYTGSVLVKYENGSYKYYFWVSNGTYTFNAATKDTYGNLEDTTIIYEGEEASRDCGQTSLDSIPSEIKANVDAVNNALITSTGTIVNITDTNTISFKINDTEYTAYENETWVSYILRTSATETTGNNGVVCISPSNRLALTNENGNCPDTYSYAGDVARDIYKHDGSSVSYLDVIIANEEYRSGGPS